MTAGELVISLVLSAAGFAASVKRSQAQLDDLSAAGRQAGSDVQKAADQTTDAVDGVSDAATKLRRAFDDAAKEGKELKLITAEAQKMRAAMTAAGASAEDLEALDQAAKKLKVSLSDAAEQGTGGFKRFAAAAAGALAVMGTLSAIRSAGAEYLAAADAVGKLSDSLGVDVVEMQAWGEAAAHAGGNTQQFYGSLGALNERILDAGKFGKGEMVEVFKALGVSATDANGKLKSATTVLRDLAASAEGMNKAQFMGLAKKLGLDQGTIMLLQSGKKSVDAAVKSATELGLYTKRDAEVAAQANDALQDMGTATRGMAAVFLRLAVPALTTFAEMLTGVARWVQKNRQFVLIFLGGLALVIGTALTPALAAMAVAAWAAIAPFAPFIALIAGVALVIDDLITYIHGGKSALSGLWSMFGTGEEIGARFGAIWDNVKTYLSAVWGILGGVKDLWVAIFSGDMDGVVGALKRIYDNVLSIKDVFANLLGYIKAKLAGLLPDWAKKLLGVGGGQSADDGDDTPEADGGAPKDGIPPQHRPPPPNAVEAGQLFDPRKGSRGGMGPVDNSRTVTSTTNIQSVTINSQAQDAQGIAQDIAPAITNQVAQTDGAFAG